MASDVGNRVRCGDVDEQGRLPIGLVPGREHEAKNEPSRRLLPLPPTVLEWVRRCREGRDAAAPLIATSPGGLTYKGLPNQRARAFLSEQRTIGRMDFVLGTRAELKPLWDGFYIRPQSVTEEHNSRFTLVDKRGFQRIGYPGYEGTPERLAHDLRILQAE